MPPLNRRVIGIRIVAVLLMIVVVPLLWRLMLWLPWQADCAIAVIASLAFAYRFEREYER
jgi:hypothetical protein